MPRVAQTVVILKVAYLHRKRTWRRIAILSRQTLDDLALAINAAFERDNDHLYSFFFPDLYPEGPITSRPKIHDALEYTHPFNAEDPGPFCDKPLHNAAKTRIASLGLAPKQRFLFLYDFGDEWWHEITVEETGAPVAKGKYPRLLDQRGDAPPQYGPAPEE